MPNDKRAWVPGGSFFFTVVLDRRRPLFRSCRARNLLGSMIRRCRAGRSRLSSGTCMGRPLSVPRPARQAGRTSNALVLLPEHLHAIWTLPPGDTAYPTRWGWISSQRSTQTLPSPHGGGRAGDGGANVAGRGGCAVRTIVRYHSATLTLTPGPSPVEGEGRGSCDNAGRKHERSRGVWQPRYWEHTLESEEARHVMQTRTSRNMKRMTQGRLCLSCVTAVRYAASSLLRHRRTRPGRGLFP
jgi:REP element-mobilizing transposase RayT